jgi:hypothetical protein
MPIKRRLGAPLILMFGVIIALVALAAPANAGDYAHHRRVSVSNETATAGSSVQFCGIGFQSLKTVTIGWGDGTTDSSAVADSSGNFCSIIVLGAHRTGTHTITAREATSGATASATIVVPGVSANVPGVSANATPPAAAGLAFTGAAVLGIGSLGGLLLVGGAALVLAGRRRKVDA